MQFFTAAAIISSLAALTAAAPAPLTERATCGGLNSGLSMQGNKMFAVECNYSFNGAVIDTATYYREPGSMANCLKACAAVPTCQSVQYQADSGNCWLIPSRPTERYSVVGNGVPQDSNIAYK